ncbi:hypothetical protein HMI56_004470 [Coelomomyces lativittatus]|nr:hypothetical protein HMI56_004470 [Coelomomyces lativittatus]
MSNPDLLANQLKLQLENNFLPKPLPKNLQTKEHHLHHLPLQPALPQHLILQLRPAFDSSSPQLTCQEMLPLQLYCDNPHYHPPSPSQYTLQA